MNTQFQKKPGNIPQPQKKFVGNTPQNQNNKQDQRWSNNSTPKITNNQPAAKVKPEPSSNTPRPTPPTNVQKPNPKTPEPSKQPAAVTPKKEATESKKFTGRSRLFIGNITEDTTEEYLRKSLTRFGDITELYSNGKRGFAFVKFSTKQSADAAKDALDGKKLNNRIVRVRFAAHGAALKVKNLSSHISNELLEQAFSSFGQIERCVHIVDDRGRPIGEGIVEFAKKMSCQIALKKCSEGCFFLGSYPKPVLVEPLEQNDDEDGHPEKNVSRSAQSTRDREKGPRFMPRGTFEFDFGMRWKELYELEKQKKEAIDREMALERNKLEEQMEFAIYEQETNVLREQLRMREEEANQILREREMRQRRVEQHLQQPQRTGGGGDMYHNSSSDAMRRSNTGMSMDDMRRRPGPDDSMMMQDMQQRNGAKMGGMNNMRGGDRGMPSSMDGGMRSMQGGGSSQMSSMQGPLVGAPVPPAELLSAALPQARQSRFDQSGYPGNNSPQVDAGNSPMSRGSMDRNDSRGGGGMNMGGGGGAQAFKRGSNTHNPMPDRWEEKRRRY